MKEQKQVRRAQDSRKHEQTTQRTARRALEQAEAEVERLQALLADPDLYLTPEGVRKAAGLGKELDQAQRALEKAFQEWGRLG